MTEPLDAGTQRLVDDLLAKPQSFDRDEILRRARKRRYHAYRSSDAMPAITLIRHLKGAGFEDLAQRAAEDLYDQDADEGRKWEEGTPEGREFARLKHDPVFAARMNAIFDHAQKLSTPANLRALYRSITPSKPGGGN